MVVAELLERGTPRTLIMAVLYLLWTKNVDTTPVRQAFSSSVLQPTSRFVNERRKQLQFQWALPILVRAACQVLDFAEFFAGQVPGLNQGPGVQGATTPQPAVSQATIAQISQAAVSDALRQSGKIGASLDITYHRSMDVLSPAGFASEAWFLWGVCHVVLHAARSLQYKRRLPQALAADHLEAQRGRPFCMGACLQHVGVDE